MPWGAPDTWLKQPWGHSQLQHQPGPKGTGHLPSHHQAGVSPQPLRLTPPWAAAQSRSGQEPSLEASAPEASRAGEGMEGDVQARLWTII